MNIAIFSGELSGDLIGGALAQALLDLDPALSLWGLGSSAMRSAGVELLADSAAWGAISITEAISKVPLVASILPRITREIRKRRPDVMVLIDFGAFNVRVARFCTKLGLKVCYYFPPGTWRRTGNRGAELAECTDLIAAPFPWAAERYRNLGANACYVGHPLLERVESEMTRAEFASQFGMVPDDPIIGLLPGSRRHEVVHLMPTLLDAARIIYKSVPNAQFVVGIAPTLSAEQMYGYLAEHSDLKERLAEIWHEFTVEAEERVIGPVSRTAGVFTGKRSQMLVTQNGVLVPADAIRKELEARRKSEHLRARSDQSPPPTVLAKGLTYEVMAHSDLLLTCSGTATLEATIFTTPMVVLYRGSKVMEMEYRLRGVRKRVPYIGLPNVLADRFIVPELIQREATPAAIAASALTLLNDPTVRQRTRSDLREVRDALGTKGASMRTAKLVLELAHK